MIPIIGLIALLISTLPAVVPFALTFLPTHRISSQTQTQASSSLQSTLTTININELAERDIDTFSKWIDTVGIQKAPGVILKGSDRYMKNVYAMTSQDIESGSPVIYVPEELIMSSGKAMAAYRNVQMEAAEKQLQITKADSELRQFYLMIQLLIEIERGTDR